jgi:hypothetical protein
VAADAMGRDLDPVLRGRVVLSEQLTEYWQHRRGVLGPAIIAAYTQAGQHVDTRSPLVAAARGHLAELRARESFDFEAGEELVTALQRYVNATDCSARVSPKARR